MSPGSARLATNRRQTGEPPVQGKPRFRLAAILALLGAVMAQPAWAGESPCTTPALRATADRSWVQTNRPIRFMRRGDLVQTRFNRRKLTVLAHHAGRSTFDLGASEDHRFQLYGGADGPAFRFDTRLGREASVDLPTLRARGPVRGVASDYEMVEPISGARAYVDENLNLMIQPAPGAARLDEIARHVCLGCLALR